MVCCLLNGREGMNWRRRLWRLWLVFSLSWIVAVGVYAWKQKPWAPSRQHTCFEAAKVEGRRNPLDCFQDETILPPYVPMSSTDIAIAAREYAASALLPPFITLALGLLGTWIVSGFARTGA
jgi:hypothetical protein